MTIAIEEHYWDDELCAYFTGTEAGRGDKTEQRIRDINGLRLAEMDEAGIDMQVLSHGPPGVQKIAPDIAISLTRKVNDRLAAHVAARPDRFAAFAMLPTSDPQAAAEELERTVGLGFKGAMIHGMAAGKFIDGKEFWPIFARAEKLDVPIYLHPALPHPAVSEAYFKDYLADFPLVARPAWGYTIETATQAIRLILSGVFEAHPSLKIILGHLGETLPFMLWRIDEALKRPGQRTVKFRDIFCNNFWITTSGFFSTPALLCSIMELGVDRILFAVDWPYVDNKQAVNWMKDISLSHEDKCKILGGNVKKLLRM
jgi:predicted TIM-barrel fold metal-dependent hydrolase